MARIPDQQTGGTARWRHSTSRFIAFLDECGDHSMETIDRDFPLFVLAAIIVEREAYAGEIVQRFAQLKLNYWDHEGVDLHSRDIRKAEGPFSILQNAERRQRFMAELSGLMEGVPMKMKTRASVSRASRRPGIPSPPTICCLPR
jgi:hypothetical protein